MKLQLVPNLYREKIGSFLMIYASLSEDGLIVLNKEAAFVFDQINGKRSNQDILKSVKKLDKNATITDVQSLINTFITAGIVYTDIPPSTSIIKIRPPTELGVWMHITNSCNLRCTYCYVHKTPDKMSEETALKSAQKIVDSAVLHKISKIKFKFAGGEPLLELKKILIVVNHLKELAIIHSIQIEYIIITNGVLLTEKVCTTLKDNNIYVAISIDGLGAVHDKTRVFTNGLGSFKYVEKGIQNIQKYGVPFNVSVTVTQKNIANIPTLTKYFLNKNIHFAFNFYRENPFVHEELEGDDKKLVHYLKKAYKILQNSPPPYSVLNSILDRVNFKKPHLYTCGMGRNYIVVRYDGKLINCQMTQDKVIGSIDDNDVIDTMIRGNFIRPKGQTVDGKKECQSCQWKYICCGGCPLLTKEQKGRFNTNSPYCNVYKELIPEALKVEAQRIIKYSSI